MLRFDRLEIPRREQPTRRGNSNWNAEYAGDNIQKKTRETSITMCYDPERIALRMAES
ncbi:MAG: hypothetical protein ACK553_18775 [Planctomycetota bacterium]|jgi:hypothetical protein